MSPELDGALGRERRAWRAGYEKAWAEAMAVACMRPHTRHTGRLWAYDEPEALWDDPDTFRKFIGCSDLPKEAPK